METLWCKKDAECTKMVIKKVLDSGTFTALQKSLLYIPPRAVSRNVLVVSVFYFRDGGRTENMWGQAVIKCLLINRICFKLYQNLWVGGLYTSLPPSFPSALDFIIAAKHEKTAKNRQLLSQNRTEESSEVSLQGLFCEFFHFHNSK